MEKYKKMRLSIFSNHVKDKYFSMCSRVHFMFVGRFFKLPKVLSAIKRSAAAVGAVSFTGVVPSGASDVPTEAHANIHEMILKYRSELNSVNLERHYYEK